MAAATLPPAANDPPLSAAQAPAPALAHWLRLLWGRAPTVLLDSDAPQLSAGVVHLPAAAHWRAHCAAAAHAVAHLVYSPAGFEAEGLVPIARTLLATLEDARVEALAMRELPGLARLWRPLHTATPALGWGFEALLQRLARALADPAYDDPHPWVRKGRALFYLDAALGLPALRTPAELRSAAMALGHDIGQLRLPFNAKGHRPQPAYRDDHRWMWPADQLQAVAPPPASAPGSAGPSADPLPEAGAATATVHPEWDRLIRRLRPDWCTVLEQRPGPAAALPADLAAPAVQPLARRLRAPLRRLAGPPRARRLAAEGEQPDLDALLHWQLARRAGVPGDGRVMRALQRSEARAAVWLLVDTSASSADAAGAAGAGANLLATATQAAAATALALRAAGVACAVSGFASHGRHAVRLHTLQGLQQTLPDGVLQARLQALQPGGSTRLGGVLRHAVAGLRRWHAGPRWVLLLSDAQAHDIDVHDPRYLRADARHALRSAARQGVRVACLALVGGHVAEAVEVGEGAVFPTRMIQPLSALRDLPRALQRLLG